MKHKFLLPLLAACMSNVLTAAHENSFHTQAIIDVFYKIMHQVPMEKPDETFATQEAIFIGFYKTHNKIAHMLTPAGKINFNGVWCGLPATKFVTRAACKRLITLQRTSKVTNRVDKNVYYCLVQQSEDPCKQPVVQYQHVFPLAPDKEIVQRAQLLQKDLSKALDELAKKSAAALNVPVDSLLPLIPLASISRTYAQASANSTLPATMADKAPVKEEKKRRERYDAPKNNKKDRGQFSKSKNHSTLASSNNPNWRNKPDSANWRSNLYS